MEKVAAPTLRYQNWYWCVAVPPTVGVAVKRTLLPAVTGLTGAAVRPTLVVGGTVRV